MPRLRTVTIGIAAAMATIALGIGGATSAAAATRMPNAPAGHGAKVSTASTGLGAVLVGPNGHTLYLFEKDEHSTKSHCYKACAKVWTPLLTKGAPRAGGKAKASKLGTSKRKNGTRQVTYAGHPVYYYAGDASAGTTSGEGVKEFGAEWYVLNPHGKKIEGAG